MDTVYQNMSDLSVVQPFNPFESKPQDQIAEQPEGQQKEQQTDQKETINRQQDTQPHPKPSETKSTIQLNNGEEDEDRLGEWIVWLYRRGTTIHDVGEWTNTGGLGKLRLLQHKIKTQRLRLVFRDCLVGRVYYNDYCIRQHQDIIPVDAMKAILEDDRQEIQQMDDRCFMVNSQSVFLFQSVKQKEEFIDRLARP